MDAVQIWVRDQYIPAMTGAGRAVRLDTEDGREVRLESVDPMAKAAREMEERLDESVKRTEWRLNNQWKCGFDPNGYKMTPAAGANNPARHDTVDELNWRLNNQWRSDFDPKNYERERDKA